MRVPLEQLLHGLRVLEAVVVLGLLLLGVAGVPPRRVRPGGVRGRVDGGLQLVVQQRVLLVHVEVAVEVALRVVPVVVVALAQPHVQTDDEHGERQQVERQRDGAQDEGTGAQAEATEEPLLQYRRHLGSGGRGRADDRGLLVEEDESFGFTSTPAGQALRGLRGLRGVVELLAGAGPVLSAP